MEEDMNQTSWLEQTLDKEKQRLVSARQALKKNPASYSARVTLQSAENRLADLQHRIQSAGASHDWSPPTSCRLRGHSNPHNIGFSPDCGSCQRCPPPSGLLPQACAWKESEICWRLNGRVCSVSTGSMDVSKLHGVLKHDTNSLDIDYPYCCPFDRW